MRYYFLLFTCVPILFLQSCDSFIDNELSEAEKLMTASPDSSLSILERLKDNYSEMSEKEKALFGLLYFQALDKNTKELTPREMIDFSVEYYKNGNQKDRSATAYLYKSRMYKNRRDYTGAIQNLLRAADLAAAGNNSSLLGKIYFDLGHVSGYQEEINKALEYYEKAITHFEKTEETDNISKVYLMIGLIYQSEEDYDTAIEYETKALTMTSDSVVMGDVYNDLGTYHLQNDRFDSAVYYARKSLHYPYFDTNLGTRYYNLANVYFFSDENDSAVFYVNKALEGPIDIYFVNECYRMLTNIAFETGDKDDIAFYLKKYHESKDSIDLLERQPNIHVLEQLHASDTETVKIKDHRSKLVVAAVIIAIICCVVFAVLHKKGKRKQMQADSYKEELEKKHELFLLDLADELEQTKAKYADRRKKSNFEEREQIDKIVFNEVLHFDDEKVFTDKMNKVLNQLPDKLRSDYPDINYKEILWCCLFMLQLSTTEIALIMGYTQSSQYKFKQRLCKKLNFDSSKDLEQMLHEKINIS